MTWARFAAEDLKRLTVEERRAVAGHVARFFEAQERLHAALSQEDVQEEGTVRLPEEPER